MTITRLVLIALLVSMPSTAGAGPADEANAVVDRWAATFNANDAAGVVSLYTADAVLLGTISPTIAHGTDAIRAYFSRLPGSGSKVAIGERRTIVVNDTAVTSTGFYEFTIMRDGQPVIAHHRSSFRPKPPQ